MPVTRSNIWNVETSQVLQTLTAPSGEIRSIAFHPDGLQLAAGFKDLNSQRLSAPGTKDNQIAIWDARPLTLELREQLNKPADEAPTVAELNTLLEIAAFERALTEDPDQFNRNTHEQLRQLSNGRDENKSLYHCEEILRHSMLDGEIIAVLADGQIETNPELAVTRLLT